MQARVDMLEDVTAERLGVAELLDTLTDQEWNSSSLCPGWTVRDVVAHLTFSTDQPLLPTVLGTVRAGGDMDAVFADMARARARTVGCDDLVARLRAIAGVDRRFPLAGRLDPLNDLLVHGQDIAIPLGRTHPMPIHRVLPCLTHAWRSPVRRPSRRFAGLRFVATDVEIALGDGPTDVRGPAGALLLVINGRAAGVAELTGPGADQVAERLQA